MQRRKRESRKREAVVGNESEEWGMIDSLIDRIEAFLGEEEEVVDDEN